MLHCPHVGAPPPKTLRMRGSLCALQAGALLLLVGGQWTAGFPLDDAWIHQQVARTLAETGTLGLYSGQHGAGATSYLWALLLAGNYASLNVSPVLFANLINAALFLVSGQLLLSLLLRDGWSSMMAWTGAVLFSLAANGVWFVVSGMEATTFVFLSLLSITLWRRADPQRGSVGAGVAAAALFLLRPEAVLLTPVLLLLSGRPRLSPALKLLLPVLLTVLGYALTNWMLTGRWSPATLGGRRWLYFGGLAGLRPTDFIAMFLLNWTDRLAKFVLAMPWGLAFWPALGLAIEGGAEIVRRRERGIGALCAWTLAHLATFALVLPCTGHGGRYQPLLPGLFLLLVAQGMISVDRMVRRRLNRDAEASRVWPALALLGSLSGVALFNWRGAHAAAVLHINNSEIGMARIVAKLPAEARVASFDIGAVSYFSGRHVLDLGGLADPSLEPLLWQGQTALYLRAHKIDYVALPVPRAERYQQPMNFMYRLGLLDRPGLKLIPVAFAESPGDIWGLGMEFVTHSSPRQRLYRIEWTTTEGST